ncbi:L,D-transpeptidase family protein [Methylobacterium durans]|uniref:Murein L,D-transpeptidase n=1 Tax=Methylobacterium durans TaxID=2202825 RepID=A0A2U8W648_9HYPH|nr:L,D-transpeptidase family protein [Methylobacterium durans]AWN41118.1 murein L,D-transpeptidase [Methylobacterium durans]
MRSRLFPSPFRLRAGLSPLALIAALGTAAAQTPPIAPQPAAEPPAAAAAPAPPAPSLPAPPAQPLAESPAPAAPAKKSREPAPLVYARVSEDPVPTLAPSTFLDTLRMAERYQAYAEAGGWESLAADLVLKPGAQSPSVPSLRHHLTLTGDLPADATPSDRHDAALVAAVKSFQARHGLPETGIVARQTVAALNVPAAVRQRQLAASAARLMGSNFPFGERYVTVNIPSATVEAVEKGAVARRYVAVVGSTDKPTPAVETRITDVNLNPTWTVPVSVVRNEIIPKMRKDPTWLAKNRIRILGPGGIEVDPTTVDWKTERAVNYTLRQDSGLDNSLGQVRIDMPNRHAVYMHDTPSKSLFARSVRFHSHGCVRVGQVKEFAGWLLASTPGPNGPGTAWGPMEIETGIAMGDRRDIKLTKPVPVTFVYLTGYATPDGRAHFRDDIYGLDTPSAAPAPSAAAPEPQTTGSIPARPAAPKPPRTEPVPSAAPKPEARKPIPPTAAAPRAIAREPVLLPPGLVGPRA